MSIRNSLLALAAISLIAVSVPASAKDTVVESIWTAVPLTIDGLAQEWNDATPILDKASNAQYALKNDGKNLYIIMVMRDDVARSTIAYTGMKIYLTAGPKKSKEVGVLFMQKQLTPDQLIASLEKKGETVTEEKRAEIRKQKSYAVFLEEAIVPKDSAPGSGAADTLEPAVFRVFQKDKLTSYEFMVPLSRFGQPGTAVQAGTAVKLGFEWGGMTKEIMKDIMARRADAGSQARDKAVSSDAGFSDRSGDGEGGGQDFAAYIRDKRNSKHAFWIDVKLAAPAK
jgi:hypothetical protein